MDSASELLEYLDFAKNIVIQSGEMIVSRQRTSFQVSPKGQNDFVTDVDIASQDLILNLLQNKYPHHGYLTEEPTHAPGPRTYTWVLDPIDGTVNYIRQRSPYCISLGLLIDNVPKVGVIYEPVRKEMFSAASGHGFYLNERRMAHGARIANLNHAAIALDWDISTSLRIKAAERIQNLINRVQTVPIIGCASLALAWIAARRIDGYFKFETHPWDVVAGAVMIRETFGRVSRHNNEDWDWRSADKSILASNGIIHETLLSYFE